MSALLAWTGCDDDDDDDDDRIEDAGIIEDAGPLPPQDAGFLPDGALPPGATATARAIHLSPDAPAVDAFLKGPTIVPITNLEFTESTAFATIPAGTYDVVVKPAGTETVVLDVQDVELMAGVAHTLVAFDRVDDIQALVLIDDFSQVPAGNVRVRAIHTAPALGTVDVFAVAGGGTLVPLYTDLGFGEVGDYLEVPAVATRIGVDVNDDGAVDAVFDIPALPEGTVANLFAVNDAAGNPFLLGQLPDGQTARLDPVQQ